MTFLKDEMKFLGRYRDLLNQGNQFFYQLFKKMNLKLAVDRLAYISHWVTPKFEMKRYSTRFS
ncbi:MAG: hypothetical protein CM15mP22_3770 [Gammaproteobacteria bacterium]|nr:MAG: hypothetical protein CM15mP22_3770 [Gammaproteobacteria bacterium]